MQSLTHGPNLADEAIKSRLLQEVPDLETEHEAIHTWKIEDWKDLPRKTHGPTFECGGYPWYDEMGPG